MSTNEKDTMAGGKEAGNKDISQGIPFLATTPGVVLGALGCCLLWGSAFPCIKIGYQLFQVDAADSASQLLFAGARFTLAGIMVVAFSSVRAGHPVVPRRRDAGTVLVLALFQTVLQYVFFYMGLSKAAGITSSIIEASFNFFAILFSALLFRQERLTGRKLLGCAVGLAGVVAVNLGGSGSVHFALDGEGLILVSALAGAMSTCLIQRFSADHDPVMLSGWQFLVGGIVLVVMGLLGGGRLDATGAGSWALLVYMAFISAAAYSVWSLLLQVNPVSRVSVFGFMNPVFGAVLSALLLSEGSVINPWLAVLALVLVAMGIVIVNRAPKVASAA